jgi:MFS family permease
VRRARFWTSKGNAGSGKRRHIGDNTLVGINTALGDIAHVIQLAIAPVFLLTAVGTLLGVLSGRLSRAVDRRRVLIAGIVGMEAPQADKARGELAFVQERIRIIYAAIALAVSCALLICLLIAVAFVDALLTVNLVRLIAVLFVLGMLALIGSLVLFLREIYLGVNTIAVEYHR